MRHHHIFVWGLVGSVGKAFGNSGAGVQSVGCLLVSKSGVPVGSSSYWQVAGWCLINLVPSVCSPGAVLVVG